MFPILWPLDAKIAIVDFKFGFYMQFLRRTGFPGLKSKFCPHITCPTIFLICFNMNPIIGLYGDVYVSVQ
jgi:hypothetical protein